MSMMLLESLFHPQSILALSSVHLRVSERLTLVAGRDGGLQNMEILGIIMLRVADSEFGHIRIAVDNHEQRSVQFQVRICVVQCKCVWSAQWRSTISTLEF